MALASTIDLYLGHNVPSKNETCRGIGLCQLYVAQKDVARAKTYYIEFACRAHPLNSERT